MSYYHFRIVPASSSFVQLTWGPWLIPLRLRPSRQILRNFGVWPLSKRHKLGQKSGMCDRSPDRDVEQINWCDLQSRSSGTGVMVIDYSIYDEVALIETFMRGVMFLATPTRRRCGSGPWLISYIVSVRFFFCFYYYLQSVEVVQCLLPALSNQKAVSAHPDEIWALKRLFPHPRQILGWEGLIHRQAIFEKTVKKCCS